MTITKGKPAGAPASNQYGEFQVKYCSPAQARFIQRLLDERVHDFQISDAKTVNKKHASRIIEQLLQCSKKPEAIEPISEKQLSYIDALVQTREGASEIVNSFGSIYRLDKDKARDLIDSLVLLQYKQQAEPEIEVGAYLHDGVIYSVRKNSGSGRLHAFTFDHDLKAWSYARGIVNKIKKEERLTLAQASKFGAQTGCCVHCGRTLTVQKSIVAGMGKICASRYN